MLTSVDVGKGSASSSSASARCRRRREGVENGDADTVSRCPSGVAPGAPTVGAPTGGIAPVAPGAQSGGAPTRGGAPGAPSAGAPTGGATAASAVPPLARHAGTLKKEKHFSLKM